MWQFCWGVPRKQSVCPAIHLYLQSRRSYQVYNLNNSCYSVRLRPGVTWICGILKGKSAISYS